MRISPAILLSLGVISILFLLMLSYPNQPEPILKEDLEIEKLAPWLNSNNRFVPFDYFDDREFNPNMYMKDSNSCTIFPSLLDLQYSSQSWQTLETKDGVISIYGAYWDHRVKPAVIRLLVYVHVSRWTKLYCHLWYTSRGSPITVAVESVIYLWDERWGTPSFNKSEPYLVTCPAPASVLPRAVSLTTEPCAPVINVLTVQHESPKRGRNSSILAVCTKYLFYPTRDVSAELVEWLELLRLFGAGKVFVHLMQVHPNVMRVLDEYSRQGFLEVTEYNLPPPRSFHGKILRRYMTDSVSWKDELLPYNDCLYRNIRNYRWLVAIDLDELIVPMVDNSWLSLLRRLKRPRRRKTIDAYCISNIYFLESLQEKMKENNSVPSFTNKMKQVWRTRNYSENGDFMKSFHNTKTVLGMHNHSPLKCLSKRSYECFRKLIPTSLARLQHYRRDCLGHLSKKQCDEACEEPVRDTMLWRWNNVLVDRVRWTLNKLNIATDNL